MTDAVAEALHEVYRRGIGRALTLTTLKPDGSGALVRHDMAHLFVEERITWDQLTPEQRSPFVEDARRVEALCSQRS